MPGVNSVMLQGNITDEIVLKQTTDKKIFFVNFSICQNQTYGEKNIPMYCDVKAWRATAEFIRSYFKKGQNIIVEGELQMDSYKGADGTNRTKHFILANKVHFGDRKKPSNEPEALPPLEEQTPPPEIQ